MTTNPTRPLRAREGSPASSRGAPDFKLLIMAAALASTLGGWASLAAQEDEAVAVAAQAEPGIEPSQELPFLVLDAPPLPTLEPLPTLRPLPTLEPTPSRQATAGNPLPTGQVAQARVAAPAPVAAPPAQQAVQPAPQPAPALRVVSPPPARAPKPVAMTRSSR